MNPNACLTLAPIYWRTIFKKKISFSYLLTYQFRSLYWCKFFCWISIARRSNGVIPKTEEHFHFRHYWCCISATCWFPLPTIVDIITLSSSLHYSCHKIIPIIPIYLLIILLLPICLLIIPKIYYSCFRKWIHSSRISVWYSCASIRLAWRNTWGCPLLSFSYKIFKMKTNAKYRFVLMIPN